MLMAIPFPGFYETALSEGIDSDICQYIDRVSIAYRQLKGVEPDQCSLYTELQSRYSSSAMMTEMAKSYSELFIALVNKELIGDERYEWKWAFSHLVSPREYNFSTDRLLVAVDKRTANRLLEVAHEDDFRQLESVVKERFTPREGFIPHYSHLISHWKKLKASSCDPVKLETLLLAALKVKGIELSEVEEEILDIFSCNGMYSKWETSFDEVSFLTKIGVDDVEAFVNIMCNCEDY